MKKHCSVAQISGTADAFFESPRVDYLLWRTCALSEATNENVTRVRHWSQSLLEHFTNNDENEIEVQLT